MTNPLLPTFSTLPISKWENGKICISSAYHENIKVWDNTSHEEALYLPAIQQICKRHQLPEAPLKKYESGTMVVFALGQNTVIKLYCPLFYEDYKIERSFLESIEEKLGIPTPKVIATGEFETWPYLIMSQLSGQPLSTLWHTIPEKEKESLLVQMGRVVHHLHHIPVSKALSPWVLDWPEFLKQQTQRTVTQQKQFGLAPEWLEQILPYLQKNEKELPITIHPVPLHTELVDSAWLVEEKNGHWKLSGLFDFGDAFIGDADYDLLAIPLFFAGGNPKRFSLFLESYEYPSSYREMIPTRFMLYTLLHFYSHLPWFFRKNPPPDAVKTFENLSTYWFNYEKK